MDTRFPQTSSLGEKTSVAIARLLRDAILLGELAPGSRLGEESLARQYGVSRTPIREALLLLRNEHLVEVPPNRPAVVRRFTAADLTEMHTLRAVLEGHAARTAADQLTDAELLDLEESCARYGRLRHADEALPRLVEENLIFHDTIITAAASERLVGLIRQVTALPLIYRSYMTYSHTNRATAWEQHRRILSALKERNGSLAEEAMKAHVLWARDLALRHLPLVVAGESAA